MVAVGVSTFVTSNLKLIFVLSLVSEYLGLCSLTILLKYLRHSTAASMRSKVRWFLYPLHCLYAIVLIIGLTNDVGATCNTNKGLPTIFFLKDGCYVLYFILLLSLYSKKFLIEWKHPGAI